MQSRRAFLLSVTVAGATIAIGAPVCAASSNGHARSAKAITQVFGDGVRLVAVAIEYDVEIDGTRLEPTGFSVTGRTVTGVYTSNSGDPAGKAGSGRFVIVMLSPDDAAASLVVQAGERRNSPPGAEAGEARESGPPSGGPPGGMGKAGTIPANGYDARFRPAEATIVQTKALTTLGGKALPVEAQGNATTGVINLVVDDFEQHEFQDSATGRKLAYNLFVPKDYDPSRSYPLVLFMHDAGATSDVTRTTLFQGLGAVSWASAQDQAARPCFVLAPQYAEIIADDDSRTSSMLDTTINLIAQLSRQYHIDPGRLYATGQSGGCMMAIAMNIKYPDLFAASFLVAGQWDPALVAPLASNKLWILVSQDDDKAFPGQNAITEALEAKGAKISRAVWDGTWSAEQFRFAFDDLDREASSITYVSFAAGTVIPRGASTAGASGHRNTWRIAYSIEPIREWIFRQRARVA